MNIKTKLQQIANMLNEDKINWNDPYQKKYFIYYDYAGEELQTMCLNSMQILDIYCLDENFLNKAVNEVGKESIIDLFKNNYGNNEIQRLQSENNLLKQILREKAEESKHNTIYEISEKSYSKFLTLEKENDELKAKLNRIKEII
jgi:hypothetical protein